MIGSNLDCVQKAHLYRAFDEFIEELYIELSSINLLDDILDITPKYNRALGEIEVEIKVMFRIAESQRIEERVVVYDKFRTLNVKEIAEHLCYLASDDLLDLESDCEKDSPFDEFDSYKIKKEESI